MLVVKIELPDGPKVKEGERGWRGSVGGYRPRRREAIVDLSEPEEPTIAVQEPGRKVKEMLCKIGTLGREGYVKEREKRRIGRGVRR